jgi:hypothetical protein
VPQQAKGDDDGSGFAWHYGIPVWTVRYWIQTGQGPKSSKIGRQRLFHKSEVAAWEAEAFDLAA